MRTSPKKIHIIAICGVGMSALAGLLKKKGYRVSGSDAQIYPPMSLLLEAAQIPLKNGFHADHIEPDTDWVIIGNAVPKTNPEVVAALERNIPYYSMPEALSQFFLKDKQSLVVAGTHGKTTTTSLLAWVLTYAGVDPGLMVGGWANNFDSNHRMGNGPHFVVEGDEYDTAFFDKGPKFLHYRPFSAILTSIEMDHADIYPNLAAIQEAFRKLIQLLPRDGCLVAAAGWPAMAEIVHEAACPVQTYGVGIVADWTASVVAVTEETISFDVSFHGKQMETFDTPLAGRHNINNALGVIALCHHLGISWNKIREAVLTFKGVKRRQEIVGSVNDIIVMDDFAHHPTAISETLSALRWKYPNRRLWAVFEPRSATSRRNLFQDGFVDALALADRTILADVFASDKLAPELRLSPEKIVADLKRRRKEAYFIPTPDQVVEALAQWATPSDLICIMSSGAFGGIHQKLLSGLERMNR